MGGQLTPISRKSTSPKTCTGRFFFWLGASKDLIGHGHTANYELYKKEQTTKQKHGEGLYKELAAPNLTAQAGKRHGNEIMRKVLMHFALPVNDATE